MNVFAQFVPNRDVDANAAAYFAAQRGVFVFAGFDSSAWKFPEVGQNCGRCALRNQVAAFVLNDGSNDANNLFPHCRDYRCFRRDCNRNG